MTDKIVVGKLAGCRVCDVIPDHYEYLIWANKCGMLHFTKIVTETIQEHAGFKNQQVHYQEEVAPYTETPKISGLKYDRVWLDDIEDDIPF